MPTPTLSLNVFCQRWLHRDSIHRALNLSLFGLGGDSPWSIHSLESSSRTAPEHSGIVDESGTSLWSQERNCTKSLSTCPRLYLAKSTGPLACFGLSKRSCGLCGKKTSVRRIATQPRTRAPPECSTHVGFVRSKFLPWSAVILFVTICLFRF